MEKKTRSVTITKFDYIISNDHGEELDDNGHPNHYSEFDEAGRPLREVRFNHIGEFEEMFEYRYDAKGNLEHESYYPVENEIAEEKTFFHNDDGRILSVAKKYQDGSVDTMTYEYNDAGQLVRRVTASEEGETEQVETFEWENGEVVRHVIVDEYGESRSGIEDHPLRPGQTEVTRDESGRVVREEELDEDGNVYMTVARKYNDDGSADEVDVRVDGRGMTVSRHYYLKYQYTFFE